MSPLVDVPDHIVRGRLMKLRPPHTGSSRREYVSIG